MSDGQTQACEGSPLPHRMSAEELTERLREIESRRWDTAFDEMDDYCICPEAVVLYLVLGACMLFSACFGIWVGWLMWG